MTSTRTPWWATLVLSFPLALLAAGCAEEATEPTPAPETTPVPAPTPAPTPAPAPSPAEKTEAPKPDPTASEPAQTEAPKVEPPKVEAPKVEAPKAAAVAFSEEELAAIGKLSKEDQEAAKKQGVCPVSGDNLGAMDTPVKVTAEGRTFFLCCKGCEKEVKDNPKDVVAKLAK